MKGFKHYLDKAKKWRWNLQDGNHEIVADSGQGFDDRKDSEKEAKLFETLGPSASERNAQVNSNRSSDPEWEYYIDNGTEWRWRFIVGGSEIIADSSEGYDSESNVKRAIANVKDLLKELSKRIKEVLPHRVLEVVQDLVALLKN